MMIKVLNTSKELKNFCQASNMVNTADDIAFLIKLSREWPETVISAIVITSLKHVGNGLIFIFYN